MAKRWQSWMIALARNPRVTRWMQGNRATARSTFIFYKLNGSVPEAAVAGRYEDELVRENGAWKFLRRTALPPG